MDGLVYIRAHWLNLLVDFDRISLPQVEVVSSARVVTLEKTLINLETQYLTYLFRKIITYRVLSSRAFCICQIFGTEIVTLRALPQVRALNRYACQLRDSSNVRECRQDHSSKDFDN